MNIKEINKYSRLPTDQIPPVPGLTRKIQVFNTNILKRPIIYPLYKLILIAVVVFLIGLAASRLPGLILGPGFSLKEISLPLKDDQKFTSKYLKDREDPLFGVNGVVSEIENEANRQKVLKIRSDIGPTYTATIDENTLIFSITRDLAKTEVETIRIKSTPEDIKVGSKIYTRSKKDLLVNFNLAPEDIKGIDIYVN